MGVFLESISSVTGPLSLVAFLAVIALAMFRRSVKDERGLEYLYNLVQSKLTRDQFYHLASDIIRRGFWLVIIIFVASLGTFLADKLIGPLQKSK